MKIKMKVSDHVCVACVLRSDDVLPDHGAHSSVLSVPPWSSALTHPWTPLDIPNNKNG